jgi:hypothetical protein
MNTFFVFAINIVYCDTGGNLQLGGYSKESIYKSSVFNIFCDSGGVAVKMGKESLNHAPTQVWWKLVLFSLWSHRRPCHSIWSGRGRKKHVRE